MIRLLLVLCCGLPLVGSEMFAAPLRAQETSAEAEQVGEAAEQAGVAAEQVVTAAENATDGAASAEKSSAEFADAEAVTGPPSAEQSEEGGAAKYPFVVLGIGVTVVLGLIIGLKINAFLSLIIAALVVSLMVGGDPAARMEAVVKAFGSSAGSVGIVIAMAAIIGKCMLDSGAADRVVRTAVRLTGEKKASAGLMGSGFLLAVPVFFDTVFYLLVPLARSLHRRTGRHYLRYLMAIATGGAITHTLVPPTPGPLLVASTLGVDIGMMIFVGLLVAIPSALVGLVFSVFVDGIMPVPMRSLGPGSEKHEPLAEEALPSLGLSLLPVLLPLVLIGLGTLATTLADREDRATLQVNDIENWGEFQAALRTAAESDTPSPGRAFVMHADMDADSRQLLLSETPLSETQQQTVTDALNEVLLARDVYSDAAFRPVALTKATRDMAEGVNIRTKPVDRRRMNRLLLEESFPSLVSAHEWESPMRRFAQRTALWSNANFALLLAALVSIWTLKSVRRLSLRDTANEVEESLMSGGVIILITAAGGAFGAMLNDAQIGDSIQSLFRESSAGGIGLLLLAYAIAAVLKVAQGSSTVAMIVASGMVGAIASGVTTGYHPVYLGTAVGAGSLFGSWMNDSGFWVFAKMGGLTEGEALKSWTLLLLVLSFAGLATTVLLSQILPLVSG